jgi:hypothetical protein
MFVKWLGSWNIQKNGWTKMTFPLCFHFMHFIKINHESITTFTSCSLLIKFFAYDVFQLHTLFKLAKNTLSHYKSLLLIFWNRLTLDFKWRRTASNRKKKPIARKVTIARNIGVRWSCSLARECDIRAFEKKCKVIALTAFNFKLTSCLLLHCGKQLYPVLCTVFTGVTMTYN